MPRWKQRVVAVGFFHARCVASLAREEQGGGGIRSRSFPWIYPIARPSLRTFDVPALCVEL